ncbi:MAG: DUF1501 domain-containing protein [Bacteroidota bacterium]
MKRREFLHNLAMATGVTISVAGIPIKAFARPFMNIQSSSGKILVLIQLKGGNDGLNTVIPLDQYSIYISKRPNLKIDENLIVKLTDATGVHPALAPLKPLFDEGKLTVIQGVGYPNQNRSHFRSTDIWLTASDSDKYIFDGWVGRYLLKAFPDYPNIPPAHPMAIQIGSVQSGLFDSQQGGLAVAFDNPDSFYQLVNGISADADPPPATIAGDELKFLKEVAALSVKYASVIKEKADKGNPKQDYSKGGTFGGQLKIIADLIAGGLETPVYLATLDGFDTHANQANTHQTLLSRLGESLKSFQADLEQLGFADKVVVLTFSEFGRRVTENGSLGTDHGAALPMFLVGKNIQAGIFGLNPDLTNLDNNGDVKFLYDFRQVYATMLKDHFGMTNQQVKDVLFKDFQTLPLLKLITNVEDEKEIPAQFTLSQNYPNPFNPETVINYQLSAFSFVTLKVYDVLGKEVATLVNEYQQPGEYNSQFSIRNYQLSSGVYFYQLRAGNFVETKKMILQK